MLEIDLILIKFIIFRPKVLPALESVAIRPIRFVGVVEIRLIISRNQHARNADIQLLRPVHVRIFNIY